MPQVSSKFLRNIDRRAFIGGSDARIIMGSDEAALVRLWREKALMPEDAKEAIGHGVKAKRSKSGAVSFDVLETEATHAPVQ
jgi:hypothetical protein